MSRYAGSFVDVDAHRQRCSVAPSAASLSQRGPWDEADERARALVDAVGGGAAARLYGDPEHERMVWEIRESGLGATARVPGDDTWEGWRTRPCRPSGSASAGVAA